MFFLNSKYILLISTDVKGAYYTLKPIIAGNYAWINLKGRGGEKKHYDIEKF